MVTRLNRDDFFNLITVNDFNINKLLYEVNKITNETYLIEEVRIIKKRFFITCERIGYKVYKILDKPTVQMISFIDDNNELTPIVSKPIICSYLSGIISGFNLNNI